MQHAAGFFDPVQDEFMLTMAALQVPAEEPRVPIGTLLGQKGGALGSGEVLVQPPLASEIELLFAVTV